MCTLLCCLEEVIKGVLVGMHSSVMHCWMHCVIWSE